MATQTTTLATLYEPIAGPLQKVRDSVAQIWSETLQLVNITGDFSDANSGKMLRPALCLLSAGVCGSDDISSFVPLATSMEILHCAALAHDDVVDGANVRRGATSLNALSNDKAAVLGGDFLVAKALAEMSDYNSLPVITEAIDCVRQMAEAELAALYPPQGEHSHEEYCKRLAKKKTGSLFGISCSAPSHLLNPEHNDSLREFGVMLGIAFQIVDDVLDLTQDQGTLGKPACGDIVEGKETLPIYFLRECIEGDDLARLDSMKNSSIASDDRKWVSEQLERTGSGTRTMDIARHYAQKAGAKLEGLPEGTYLNSMRGLIEFILIRGY